MRYLTLKEILILHTKLAEISGGSCGIRDLHSLKSALAQPHMMFGGEHLYKTLVEKAAALAFSLIMNHPFIDGNKRIGHAAMELFLYLNGYEIAADIDEQEKMILDVAAGLVNRESFYEWVVTHTKKQ